MAGIGGGRVAAHEELDEVLAAVAVGIAGRAGDATGGRPGGERDAAAASGYLLNSPRAEELVAAVRDVFAGGAPMTTSIARRVAQSFNRTASTAAEAESLSPREVEVLEWLVKGLAYKEVAAELGIRYSTVHRHLESIYRKLHAHSCSHAVAKHPGA